MQGIFVFKEIFSVAKANKQMDPDKEEYQAIALDTNSTQCAS